MINTLEQIMNMTKEQLRALDDSQKAQVKAILEAEIEKILQRNKK
jgi:hypothetical protein